MSTKRKGKATILRQVNACKTRIAYERDVLRELIDDLQAIEERCDAAVADLESAADTLSEYL